MDTERTETEKKFVADKMLGKLAKWLRILGYDTIYRHDISGDEILRVAAAGSRIILTRDRSLIERCVGETHLFIKDDHPFEQLKQIAEQFQFDLQSKLFSRCTVCNCEIISLAKDDVRGKVPEFVWETQENFAQCPECKRIYWSGSHYRRALDTLSKIFKET